MWEGLQPRCSYVRSPRPERKASGLKALPRQAFRKRPVVRIQLQPIRSPPQAAAISLLWEGL
ncbi:hypothetical protein GLE_4268 [Lysobacter enzymogenes]|uniref:Uncharacterized protein n=1 Tax=Lysobacter enzymogenes TaxID=69 RepID=A0A0S2DML0_LYSEN|nr:hypothetical protein GLE_4268 [Lysobacter enzymogenes]